jgi:hypothetical protein
VFRHDHGCGDLMRPSSVKSPAPMILGPSQSEELIMSSESSNPSPGWRRACWLVLLVTASVVFSLAFACATPFAAFAAAAACTLPRRDAVLLAIGVWLANQGIGFACLGYPWTWNCAAWGIAIGLSAVTATLAAEQVVGRLGAGSSAARAFSRHAAALVSAFVAYEVVLLVSALWLGGTDSFTPRILVRILAINAGALVGLVALQRLGIAVGIATPSRRMPFPASTPTV